MKKKVATAVATVAILSGAYAGIASASSYKVQKGDSLSKIASKHQTTVNEIKLLNGLKSEIIYVNQTLKVSVTAPKVSTTVEPVPPSAVSSTSVSIYTVKNGDFLGKIASQYKMT